MERMTKRKLQAIETKQNLLKTGLKLFNKKGFDNVTVEEIAKASNVSKGAFYVHFKSKYDLFEERFKDIDRFYINIQKEIPDHLNASEKIMLFYEKQMIYLRDELGKDLIRTVYMNAMSLTIDENHYLADPNRNLYQAIKLYVEEAIEKNEFKNDKSVEETSKLITRCMRGTIYDWMIFGDSFDLIKEMNEFTATVLDGLKRG